MKARVKNTSFPRIIWCLSKFTYFTIKNARKKNHLLSRYSKGLLIVSNLIFENLQPVTSTLVHYTYCLCSFSHVSESVSLTIISFHGVARLWPSRKIMSFPHQTTTPVVHMKHAINLLSKKEFWQKPQNGHCCRAKPAPASTAKPRRPHGPE